jgi:transposase InsO family protein
LWTDEGWLYLAIVMDLFNREIVGWSLKPRIMSGIVTDALTMACSMSHKGICWDNAPTESWFNSFKNERGHGVSYATHNDMRATGFEYIEVF